MNSPEAGSPGEPLGQKIRRLRQERAMPQERLSIEARVDQSGLSKFERGTDRHMGEIPLRRIAEALGITFEELVEGTDFPRRRTRQDPPRRNS